MKCWVFISLIGLCAFSAQGQTAISEERGETFSPDAFYFQSLDCASAPPKTPFRSHVSNRADLVRLAETQNLLGEVIANPICSLTNQSLKSNPLPDFVRLMTSECRRGQKSELKAQACKLIPAAKQYRELVARINQGPRVSLISVPDDWGLIDLRAGNWSETFNFDMNQNESGSTLIQNLMLAEGEIWASLESTVGWLQSLSGPKVHQGALAAQAVSRLYENHLGMRFYGLYNIWNCRPYVKRGELDLDACGIRRDMLFLVLSDAVQDLKNEANRTVALIEKLRQYLRHHSGRKETGIADVPVLVSDARLKRFQLIMDLDQLLGRLHKNPGAREELRNFLATRIDPSLLPEFDTEGIQSGVGTDAKIETVAYRSFTEVIALLRLISVLDSHQMADAEISRRQYALWANTHLVTELKKEIRDYLQERINIVDAFIERGAGS